MIDMEDAITTVIGDTGDSKDADALAVKTVIGDTDLPQVTESQVLQREKDLNYIGLKEFKALKKAKYTEKKGTFNKSFVLKNKKTGAIVELEGVNSFQACGFIGWKPRQVVVVETKDIKPKSKNLESENSEEVENKKEIVEKS